MDSVRDWGAAVPSCPSHFHESGLFFDFGAIRTESSDAALDASTRRSNLVFTSFTMGLFCCVVAEFSRGRSVLNFNFRDSVAHRYWQYFGTYIWFVIIGLRPLGQFLCAIVEEQLQEALLVMPVLTQRLSRNGSELQYHEDGVSATPRPRDAVFMIVREPPRLASAPRDRGTPRNGSKSPKRPPTSC